MVTLMTPEQQLDAWVRGWRGGSSIMYGGVPTPSTFDMEVVGGRRTFEATDILSPV